MIKSEVIAKLTQGHTVCWTSSRWHVGTYKSSDGVQVLYRFDVFTGEHRDLTDCGQCFVHIGGVGSDD